MTEKRWWTVVAPLNIVLVEASDATSAKQQVLAHAGYSFKPWLARGWIVREATADDMERYAAFADAWRGPQPTAKTAKRDAGKRRRKTARERLFGEREPK